MGFYKSNYENQEKTEVSPKAVNIPGPKKAAIVLVALGTEASSKIFQKMSDDEVEKITTEIARLEGITTEMREQVLQEFHHLTMAQQFLSQGGVEYARELLEAALGPVRAKEILDKVQAAIRTTGFNLLENVDPQQLVNFIQKEHPQTIALLLAHMNAQNAANILSSLPAEMH